MARRKKKKENIKLLSLIFAIVVVFTYYFYNKPTNISNSIKEPQVEEKESVPSSNLKIYFFNVGQADSILITNNNHNMLIDAGNNEGGPLLVSYIKNNLGIEEFDYVVGTHPHEDHIGGLDDIINNFNIKNVLLPDVITTTKTFEDVIDAIANKNLEITIPKIDSTYQLGESNINVLYSGTDEKELNNSSIILKLSFGNTSYLFTGDTSKEIENTILNKDIRADVLKVAHHGSKTSSSVEFLHKVNPSYAIISVAKKNSYNLPSKDTIKNLEKLTNNIYMTYDGTILLTSNGNEINIETIKTNVNG